MNATANAFMNVVQCAIQNARRIAVLNVSIIKMKKPNFRLENINLTPLDGSDLVKKITIRNNFSVKEEQTFCLCHPECDCDEECSCNPECSCEATGSDCSPLACFHFDPATECRYHCPSY